MHLLSAEGAEAFEVLPVAIRNLGPWTGGAEGEVDRLRLPYRVMLGDGQAAKASVPKDGRAKVASQDQRRA